MQGPDEHPGVHGGGVLSRAAPRQGHRAQHPVGGNERGKAGARAVRASLSPPRLPAPDSGAQLQVPGQGQRFCQVGGVIA